jgi:hypothetical protein
MTQFDKLYNKWAVKSNLKTPVYESIIPGGDKNELQIFVDAAFKHFGVDPDYVDVSGIDLGKLKAGMLKFADRAKNPRTKSFFRDTAKLEDVLGIFNKLLIHLAN